MRRDIIYGAAIVLSILLVAWGPLRQNQQPAARNSEVSKPVQGAAKPVSTGLSLAKQFSAAFIEVSKRVTPSIVMIVNEEKLQTTMGDEFFQQFQNDFFGNFFDFTPEQRALVQKTLGSGVIVRPDGYIVTNNHVVQNSTRLQVTLPDGDKLPGKVVGRDRKTDLALVKINRHDLRPIAFGNYADVEVGEWVLAIGTPFAEALHHTVTAGIVSAKGRSNVGIADYEDFLQTDAAINPGNSGGALVDLDGKLIGINTAIVSSNGSNAGVGFAIPVNIVQKTLRDLRTPSSRSSASLIERSSYTVQ